MTTALGDIGAGENQYTIKILVKSYMQYGNSSSENEGTKCRDGKINTHVVEGDRQCL